MANPEAVKDKSFDPDFVENEWNDLYPLLLSQLCFHCSYLAMKRELKGMFPALRLADSSP